MDDEPMTERDEPATELQAIDAAVPPGPSPRRQLAIMVAFLAASAVLLTLVGGVDAVGHAAAHLLLPAEGCGGG